MEIPAAMTFLPTRCFFFRTCLSDVVFDGNSHLRDLDGWVFSHCTGLRRHDLPETVGTIQEAAFQFTRLGSFHIFGEQTSMRQVFILEECADLKSMISHGRLMVVGQFAVTGCRSLAVIDLPDSVHAISPKCLSGNWASPLPPPATHREFS
jgi:hypothetical protein